MIVMMVVGDVWFRTTTTPLEAMTFASGLGWIVASYGGVRHSGERGGRMGEDGRGRMGKLKWEVS